MQKLYKLDTTPKAYWESWDNGDGSYTIHWGNLGEKGETKTIKSSLMKPASKKVKVESEERIKDGFQPFEDLEILLIEYKIDGLEITVIFTVKTIYKTGVEVEAMHGASVVALNMYDMLKPIDKGIEIHAIKLLEKKGGKSDFRDKFRKDLRAAVVVCSDSISAGHKEDRAGKAIINKLESCDVKISEYVIIPDEVDAIQQKVIAYQEQGLDLVIYTGGTGLSGRDITPEALLPLLERRIPGIEETIRAYGQERMPFAMLSRSIAGTIGDTLILALPGSTNGAKESMEAIFPAILHSFRILKGARHD